MEALLVVLLLAVCSLVVVIGLFWWFDRQARISLQAEVNMLHRLTKIRARDAARDTPAPAIPALSVQDVLAILEQQQAASHTQLLSLAGVLRETLQPFVQAPEPHYPDTTHQPESVTPDDWDPTDEWPGIRRPVFEHMAGALANGDGHHDTGIPGFEWDQTGAG